MKNANNALRYAMASLLCLFISQVLIGQSNKITVFPNDPPLHDVNSHIFGVNRNHVHENVANLPTWEAIKQGYSAIQPNVKPISENQRKLYRLGHTPTDGNWGNDGYHWETATNANAVGPYPHDAVYFGLLEAHSMDMDVIMVINYGSGTPNEAAALVNYLEENNDPEGTAWIERIAFFEIGNEQTGIWETGHADNPFPEDYATRALTFITEMEDAADQDIEFGVVASHSYQFGWSTPYPVGHPSNPYPHPYSPNGYNMIDQYVEILGDKFDFLCFHAYSSLPTIMPNVDECGDNISMGTDYDEISKRIMGVPTFSIENLIETKNMSYGDYNHPMSLRDYLEFKLNEKGLNPNQVEFALTEFSVQFLDEFDNQWPLFQSTVEALYLADNMLYALRNNYASAINFCFLHVGGPNPGSTDPDNPEYISDNLFFNYNDPNNLFKPNYFVHSMLANHLGTEVINDQVSNMDDIDIATCWDNNQYKYDNVGVVSTYDPETETICMLLVNRSGEAVTTDIDISGFSNSDYTAEIITQGGTEWTSQQVGSGYWVDQQFSGVSNINALTLDPRSINILKLTPVETQTEPTCCSTYHPFDAASGISQHTGVSVTACLGGLSIDTDPELNSTITSDNIESVIVYSSWNNGTVICDNGDCNDLSFQTLAPGIYMVDFIYDDGISLYRSRISAIVVPEDIDGDLVCDLDPCCTRFSPTNHYLGVSLEACDEMLNINTFGNNTITKIRIWDFQTPTGWITICNGNCSLDEINYPAAPGQYTVDFFLGNNKKVRAWGITVEDCGDCNSLGTCSNLLDAELCEDQLTLSSIDNSVWQINIVSDNSLEEVCGPLNNGSCSSDLTIDLDPNTGYYINILDNSYKLICQDAISANRSNSNSTKGKFEIMRNKAVLLKISPNPAGDFFKIKGIDDLDDSTILQIYDTSGKLLQTVNLVANSNSPIDISSLQQGIFFVKISSMNGDILLNEKLVKF